MAKAFAWSYSALTGYETCPRQYYHLRVVKDIKEKPSPAMLEGNRIHKDLELRVKDGRPLPEDLKKYEPLCKKFITAKGETTPEQKIALTADLEETTYFAKDVWLRGVLDVVNIKGSIGKIFDYKTGKRKPDSTQLKLFAAMAFARWPQLERVDTTFLWLKSKEVDKESFTVEDVPLIWQEFLPRVSAMEQAKETDYYPCRPSGLCRGWCSVASCEHWEEKQ